VIEQKLSLRVLAPIGQRLHTSSVVFNTHNCLCRVNFLNRNGFRELQNVEWFVIYRGERGVQYMQRSNIVDPPTVVLDRVSAEDMEY
jgi:hypothetical protein